MVKERAMMARNGNSSGMDTIDSVRERVSQCIGKDRMSLWFGDDSLWEINPTELTISVSNEFLADCIRSFCMKDLRAVANELIGHHASVQIKFDPMIASNSITTANGSLSNSTLQSQTTSQETPLEQPRTSASTSQIRPEPKAFDSRPKLTTFESEIPELLGSLIHEGAGNASKDNGIVTSGRKTAPKAKDFDEIGSPPPAKVPLSVYRENPARPSAPPRAESTGSSGSMAGMKVDHWSEFIESPSNKLARTAAQMVIERPGTLTPVLIHGPTGVGKTHLARGIADQLRIQHRLRRVIYLTAEQFTIDFTDSARGSGFASFRKKYRDIDALILDDVHFLLGKGGTLLELRNTLDNLIRNQRQVILVSDRSLNELSGLGSELHARLSGGMTCSLEPLDEAGRSTLFARLTARHGVMLDDATIQALGKMASGDARILHGLTFRLLTAQRSKGRNLTCEEAFDSSRDLLRASQPVVRMIDIEKAVCDVFGLEPKSLQTKSKSKTISQPRMLAMFLARKYTRAAYSEIGDYFGNRQHSTVISAQKKVEDWLERNELVDHSRGSVGVRDMLRNLEATLQVG